MSDREWDLPENQATPQSFFTRRAVVKRVVAYGSLGAAGWLGWNWYRGTDNAVLAAGREPPPADAKGEGPPKYTFKVSDKPEFQKVDRPLTDQAMVGRHVNYYEFSPYKTQAWRNAAALPVRPWEVKIHGHVKNPITVSVDELDKMFGNEQRVYRHRCVEGWAMVVPWVGFPLKKLLDKVEPTSKAKFVRFRTADIEALTKQKGPEGYPFPYTEGLTIAEAANDLAFLATGAYGERLLKQNGAPVRLVVPWKYGFKSAKSLVEIKFTETQPQTFWNTADPDEYGFYANVNPSKDHPRWSQATEWMIDTRAVYQTQPYNGYAKWVSNMYRGDEI